ncbi:5'-3' exonuclease PLD3 isoform X2 [Antennarius striatus]|uniref:5'-3' exonuclease PLD3 isoform X2 n=2 Tax=Antennarius striatus TaxID=241820 RepID=UPI0035B31592
MPVVLRPRKSIHSSGESQVEQRETVPRRSARLQGRTTSEDSDDSDSESVRSRVMESQQGGQPGPEEDTAEEAEALKHCSVMLDRLEVDDKSVKRESEEKEDMNRKSGKPASRIPTFHKRPANMSPNTELNAPKKDAPAYMTQSSEKTGGGYLEATKSKQPDARVLPQPSVHAPKIGFEAPSALVNLEHAAAAAHTSPMTSLKSRDSSEFDQFTNVSVRPSLRAGQGSDFPEQDKRRMFGLVAESLPASLVSHLQREGSISEKAPEDMGKGCDVSLGFTPYGDTDELESAEVGEKEAIMDEEPPWETEQISVFESKASGSSSEAEGEDDLVSEEPDHQDSEEMKEHHQPTGSQSEAADVAEEKVSVNESTSQVEPEKPTKTGSTESAKCRGCFSFTLCCFMPITLLLLGGFGHHVWRYGLPMSVTQLTAQLQLHMLDGFDFFPEPCSTDCRVHLVESIPIGLYEASSSSRRSIADSWLRLLDRANSSVHIAAFYFALRGSDSNFSDPSDSQGRKVFEQLKRLQTKGVELQIAVNAPQTSTLDTTELAATGAEVREVDLMAITGGIIHTKLWVVDQKHMYLGSANMDWRSLTQVKEVGLSVEDCSCLAQDAFRIFGVYWSLGGAQNASLPPYWPARLSALSSSQNPLHLNFNGVPAEVYLSSAPLQISARGRSDDLSSILSVIDDAQKFIYISVMDYLPLSEFTKPLRFWPAIDSALRAAACTRAVRVRLLVSCWKHSPGAMFNFLQSLQVLNRPPLKCDVDVNVFTVPSTAEQMEITFARVNHAKYMVTDRVVYIGTSNWSENYFTHTAGVGLVVNQTGSEVKKGQETLQRQAEELFLRDWTSQYASPLPTEDVDICPRD